MAVKIRLSRIGKKHAPFFRIVAVDSRKKRDGAFLEDLGTYNPLKSTIIKFHLDRIENWMAKGAEPSETVKRLIKEFKKGKKEGAAPKKVKKKAKAEPKKEKVDVVPEKKQEMSAVSSDVSNVAQKAKTEAPKKESELESKE